jgi:hypothetical protein
MTSDNLLALFRSNIIFVSGTLKQSNNGGIDYVTITKRDDLVGNIAAWDGPGCGVMALAQAQSTDAGAFATWICDYEANDIKYATLSNARPFCFTAEMNGCTFGIGSPSPGGVITVSHANAVGPGGGNLTNQVAEQRSMTSAVMPDWVRLFQPFDYNFSGQIFTKVPVGMGANLNTTTFGVLNGNNWTFWYQQHLRTQRRFMLKTFRQIDTSSLSVVVSS